MIRRPPRSTLSSSSAASDVYKRQDVYPTSGSPNNNNCAGSGSITNQPCYFKTKILRYTYNTSTHILASPTVVIDGLMGSNDHNSGRLKVSPVPERDGEYHLYYTIGDQGAGPVSYTHIRAH